VTRFTVEILPEAEAEFREAFLWYFERSPVFADALRSEVLEKIGDLEEDADTWPRNADGIRFRILKKRFKYTIHYDLSGTLVTVLAIASQSREPGYWNVRGLRESGESDA
jgi:plasmid stabilization system protein ParE